MTICHKLHHIPVSLEPTRVNHSLGHATTQTQIFIYYQIGLETEINFSIEISLYIFKNLF